MNPIFYIDFYKIGRQKQRRSNITQVWVNWTPRSTRVEGKHRVVNAGFTYLAKKYLLEEFAQNFFGQPLAKVLADFREVCQECLHDPNPDTADVEALWRLGYLPIRVYGLREGFSVPLRVPTHIITNTHPDFAWLPGHFETLWSAVMWEMSTSVTTAQRFRKVMTKWAKVAGEKDLGFIDIQGHDFSMRGMGGVEDGIISGIGHLMCFHGTDTVPAILAAVKYYGAKLSDAGSVPATEHSVMCEGCEDGELETFRWLLQDVYPTGIVSIVSDTWNLWRVLTQYVPALKDVITGRDGLFVVRPDSGDPEKIICGDKDKGDCDDGKGTLRLLAEKLGTVPGGGTFPMIDHAAAIYGDAITVERCDKILERIVTELRLSPFVQVFGIGSYTYRMVTRDTYGWAMKETACRRDGEISAIFKKPITDDGIKNSAKGLVAVYRTQESTEERPDYFAVENATEDQLNDCAFEVLFENSNLLIWDDLTTIRKRVKTV